MRRLPPQEINRTSSSTFLGRTAQDGRLQPCPVRSGCHRGMIAVDRCLLALVVVEHLGVARGRSGSGGGAGRAGGCRP